MLRFPVPCGKVHRVTCGPGATETIPHKKILARPCHAHPTRDKTRALTNEARSRHHDSTQGAFHGVISGPPGSDPGKVFLRLPSLLKSI
jgi:hypothetical protein